MDIDDPVIVIGVFFLLVTALIVGAYLAEYYGEKRVCEVMKAENFDTKLVWVALSYECYVKDGDGRFIDYDKFRALTGGDS